jgi:threonine/homoserine/homoserine lactone efflux protein
MVPASLMVFLFATVALTVTPGPAVLYIVTRSISQGRGAGVVSCLGVALGGLVHVLAAAFGLSALLAGSAMAFSLVKYAGAAYLVWLGLRKLTRPSDLARPETFAPQPLRRVFLDGVVVNVLNPKTALFFLAFLPQFVSPARGSVTAQCLALGGLFVVIALCTDAAWSMLASTAGGWLRRHPRFVGRERYVSGSVYLGLGLATAFAGDRARP